MNRQQIYDTAARHLLTQNKKALNVAGSCRYHSDDGYKCAIGCLIPDELYRTEMEGEDIEGLLIIEPKLEPILLNDGNNLDFLEELQIIHDCIFPEKWEKELRKFAKRYNLTPFQKE